MGKVKKAVKKVLHPIFTPVEHALVGAREKEKQAAKQAKEQARAAMSAAETQAAAIRQAAESQANLANQQAQGAAQAQQHAVNQANLASKLREQEQKNAQAPETKIETAAPSNPDPRRKYRAGGKSSLGGLGGTNNGIGIRL